MVMPNFLIIGTAKAGTTSITSYLAQHPEIYISPIKEPYFFSFEGEEVNFQGPGDHHAFRLCVNHLNDYQKLFENVSSEIAVGEASSTYLYIDKSAKRIRDYLPDVKIIAILRDPVDRAYSSYLHLIRDGHEKIIDFSLALKEESKRIHNNWMPLWHYKQYGFYYKQLKNYYNLFDPQQIKVFLYEDLTLNPHFLLKEIFKFLDVDSYFVPDTSVRFNISGIPRNRILNTLLMKPNPIKTALRPLFKPELRQKIRRNNLLKPQLEVETRRELSQIYRQDILQLQELINRDLSKWLT